MELNHVVAFLAVAEELHFGRAANRLCIAQPALSRTIQHLERSLGATLFDRTTRTVRLTSEGEALIAPARGVLESFAQAERAVAVAGAGEVGRIAIGFAGPSSQPLVGALAKAVRDQHPGIELVLVSTLFGSASVESLMQGEVDMAIVKWDFTPPGMRSRVIRHNRLVIALAEAHPLADRESIRLEELANEAWILLSSKSGSSLRDATLHSIHEAGFAPRIVQQAPDTWTILALVAAGVGITMTLDTVFTNVSIRGIKVVPLERGESGGVSRLIWRADNRSPALVRVLEASESVLPTPLRHELSRR